MNNMYENRIHNIRAHEFFQAQNLWRNGQKPFNENDYFLRREKYNKYIEMDAMMKHVIDCLSAITSFMDPNIEFINNNYCGFKARTFWDTINKISSTNIDDMIKTDENRTRIKNQSFEDVENVEDMNNTGVSVLLKKSFPSINLNLDEHNRTDWKFLHWITLDHNIMDAREYKNILQKYHNLLINHHNWREKTFTLAHALASCNSKTINLDVARTIFYTFPKLASQLDEDGFLPLHYAAEFCQDKQFLQFIIQQNPSALVTLTTCIFGINSTYDEIPIEKSIKNKNMDILMALAEASRESVFMKSTSNGNGTLLHYCAGRNIDISTKLFQNLIYAYQDALKTKNFFGYCPLHIALCGGNLMKVSLLLERCKEVATIADSDGCLPIMHAASYSPLEIFKKLSDIYPDGVREYDNMDNSILHSACNNCNNYETFQYICANYSYFAERQNSFGYLPLHFAVQRCRSFDSPSKALRIVYDLYPSGVNVSDQDGELPIHLVFIHDVPSIEEMRIVELLTVDFPRSLHVPYLQNDDDEYETPYLRWIYRSVEMDRLLSRVLRKQNEQMFRDLNYEARRMAMFLAFTAVSKDFEVTIWRRLMLQGNGELLMYTITFL